MTQARPEASCYACLAAVQQDDIAIPLLRKDTSLKGLSWSTGKRTTGGLIDDGVKSGVRYILNNFFDGHKQDALDLLTGTYVVKKGALLSEALIAPAYVLCCMHEITSLACSHRCSGYAKTAAFVHPQRKRAAET